LTATTNDIEIFEIILSVALALIFARVLGYILDRIKQPPVIGEILAGFLLGGFGPGNPRRKVVSFIYMDGTRSSITLYF
jgi:Kef-type K+ transport system membrane component KefB